MASNKTNFRDGPDFFYRLRGFIEGFPGTRRALAKAWGVSGPTITCYYQGDRRPNLKSERLFKENLGLKAHKWVFLGLEDFRPNHKHDERMVNAVDLSARIREFVDGWPGTVRSLAKKWGVTPCTVSCWYNGYRGMSEKSARRFYEAFGEEAFARVIKGETHGESRRDK